MNRYQVKFWFMARGKGGEPKEKPLWEQTENRTYKLIPHVHSVLSGIQSAGGERSQHCANACAIAFQHLKLCLVHVVENVFDGATSSVEIENRKLYFWFIDINECKTAINICHTDANCTNTKGSFYCTCLNGYSGNGVECVGMYCWKDALMTRAPDVLYIKPDDQHR